MVRVRPIRHSHGEFYNRIINISRYNSVRVRPIRHSHGEFLLNQNNMYAASYGKSKTYSTFPRGIYALQNLLLFAIIYL